MLAKTGHFRSADRILHSRDFTRVVKSGERRTSNGFVMVFTQDFNASRAKLNGDRRRLGVTVSRRVGNSVIRNRVKRQIREWFRSARRRLPLGADVVVIARQEARNLSSCEVSEALNSMMAGTGSS